MSSPQPINQAPEQVKEADKHNSQWHAVDLGFFDPIYNGKTVASGEPIEHAGKNTMF